MASWLLQSKAEVASSKMAKVLSGKTQQVAEFKKLSWVVQSSKLGDHNWIDPFPIGSMYGIYVNIGVILLVNVIIYSIHRSYGFQVLCPNLGCPRASQPCMMHASSYKWKWSAAVHMWVACTT